MALPFLGDGNADGDLRRWVNLFHSLPEGRRGVKWLDLEAMAHGALSARNQICFVRYFTARVTASAADPNMATRQDVYLRALMARGVIIHEGNFTEREKTRRRRPQIYAGYDIGRKKLGRKLGRIARPRGNSVPGDVTICYVASLKPSCGTDHDHGRAQLHATLMGPGDHRLATELLA